MRLSKTIAVALLVPVLASGCVVTTTRSTTWTDDGPAPQQWARHGRVESVREIVRETRGDPAAGAVAGAIIGGLVGSTLGGRSHYDRYGRAHHHGSGAGAVVGAIGGAMIGANASQGRGADRTYEVTVHFEDGGVQTFVYANTTPFRPGDWVTQTQDGLYPR